MITFRGSSVKRFVQIPSLSIGIELECKNIQWEPKMLIAWICHASIEFSMRGFGSTLDLASEVLLMEAVGA